MCEEKACGAYGLCVVGAMHISCGVVWYGEDSDGGKAEFGPDDLGIE